MALNPKTLRFYEATGPLPSPDGYNDRIQVFGPDGAFLASFGTRGQGSGEFNHAIAVAVANDGTLFAVDFGNNRIQKWRPAGHASR